MTQQLESSIVIPALRCPEPKRIDDELGNKVNELLMKWMKGIGFLSDQCEKIQESELGRYVMLCYPDCNDVGRLLFAAQLTSVFFSLDDYCDDKASGAISTMVAPRLSAALAAMESPYLIKDHGVMLDQRLNSDPALVGLRACMKRANVFATPSQIARICHQAGFMFLAVSAEAAWRMNTTNPAVWEYLTLRKMNSFLPVLPLIEIVNGFKIPADTYYSELLREVTVKASNACIIVNDIYSAQKESSAELKAFNLPLQLLYEHSCSLQEGIRLAALIHDANMRGYEEARYELLNSNVSPAVKRYLEGLEGWMGGNLEWHRTCARYRVEPHGQ